MTEHSGPLVHGYSGTSRHQLSPAQTVSVPAAPWLLYSTLRRWTFVAVLFLVTTSSYCDWFVLSVVLEPIKAEFHVSDTMLGLLSGVCFALVYAAAGIPIAHWADRGNRRTLITLAVTAWSLMTIACGYAQSFWQLALARFGLGAVEPGATPPAQSLIADYIPPARRATAFAILNSGGSLGYLAGIGIGGYVAATHGWRSAFILSGAVGLLLTVVVRLTIDEPRCHFGFPTELAQKEPLLTALAHLCRKKTYLWLLVAISSYTIFSFGISVFLPSFMIRTFQATLLQVSTTWSLAISAANLIGALGGGWLADRLGQTDVRWYAWLPATMTGIGAGLYLLALRTHTLFSFIGADFVAEAVIAVGLPVSFAAVHAVCGNSRRAIAIAIVFASIALLGGGLGPFITGALSDVFGSSFGPQGLRYSMITMVFFLVPATVAFYAASRTILKDYDP